MIQRPLQTSAPISLTLTPMMRSRSLKRKTTKTSSFAHLWDALGGAVNDVVFTNKLKKYAVCLTSEGELSLEMEKVLGSMPNAGGVKANLVMEINRNHPVAQKLKQLFESDKDKVEKYSKLLYAQACLIGGRSIDDPANFSELICELM